MEIVKSPVELISESDMTKVKLSGFLFPKPCLSVVHTKRDSEKMKTPDWEKDIALLNAQQKIEQAYEKISIYNKDITDSINYSRRIQEAILPEKEILFESVKDAFIFYKPKAIVSGDFYWFTKSDNKLLLAMVDCTGHGVPGAFMSMIGHNLLNEIVHVKDITQPSEILNRLDRGVRKLLKQDSNKNDSRDGMDIALCSIDIVTGEVEFAGANRPLFVIRKGRSEMIRGNIFPIGGMFKETEFSYTNQKMKVSEGDMIYLFSDGYADQFGGAYNKKLMSKRFKQLLRTVHPLKSGQQKKIISNFFDEWKGLNEQTDDVLVMGIKI